MILLLNKKSSCIAEGTSMNLQVEIAAVLTITVNFLFSQP